MNCGLFFRTVRYLKPTQFFYQVKKRLIKKGFVLIEAPAAAYAQLTTAPISKYHCLEDCDFLFLNIKHSFAGWDFTGNGLLWTYNQNYFDWINQEDISQEECCRWIDQFIEKLPDNKFGLAPYPTALRCINWVKFFCRYPEARSIARLNFMYSQLRFLDNNLEYHLLGNHFLEDVYALYIGGSFFQEDGLIMKSERLLFEQLNEQILLDGAHFEQSPMYHCILLDRLLDCINIRPSEKLAFYAKKMLGHLDSIVWRDGTIPKLNDSADGIAPTSEQIVDFAKRLGLEWTPVLMKECGYRKMNIGTLEAIVDVGNITAAYQPGHSHADTLNYELRIDGNPFVVDTGISTYNKTKRRQYERSTVAHNTVSVESENSSEVWGGFRVGKRCHVDVIEDSETVIEAFHDGFPKPCKRRFEMKDDSFVVTDCYDGEAVSYIHLVKDVDLNRIKIDGASKIEIEDDQYAIEYNRFLDCKVMKIFFKGKLRYQIQ